MWTPLCAFSILLVICSAQTDNKHILTPHGLRLSQCVHGATEPNAIITTVLNSTHDGVLVSYPSSVDKYEFYPTLPECIEEANRLLVNYTYTAAAAADNHDWQQNLYEHNTPSIGSFEGYYTLPAESPPKEGTLMFFIGISNPNQGILQPVVSYHNTGLCPSGEWCVVSWYCCPGGNTYLGSAVELPPNAKNVYGIMSANSTHIFVQSQYNGKESTLTHPLKGDTWDSIDVTLEQWNIQDCKGYTNKPFNFTRLKIKTENGENFTPQWQMQQNTSCHGGIKVYNDFNVGIWGADKPN
eukprot:113385_1